MHIIPFLCTSISSSVESLAGLGDDRKGTGEPSVTVHCVEGGAGRPRPEKSSTPQRLLDNVCCLSLICHGNTSSLSGLAGRGQGQEVLCCVSLSLPGLSSTRIISRRGAIEQPGPCLLKLTCLHQLMGEEDIDYVNPGASGAERRLSIYSCPVSWATRSSCHALPGWTASTHACPCIPRIPAPGPRGEEAGAFLVSPWKESSHSGQDPGDSRPQDLPVHGGWESDRLSPSPQHSSECPGAMPTGAGAPGHWHRPRLSGAP